MAMPDTARRYTVAEVLEFPADGNRYELVHGELLVTPSPRVLHQVVLGRFYVALHQYLEPYRGFGQVFLAPADITWGSDDTLVQPDIFVAVAADVSPAWITVRTLLLAVEVVSPSSARFDRVKKRRLYQGRGVATYWIVDPDAQVVEVWHPDDERPEVVTDILSWQVDQSAESLILKLDQLFGNVPR